MKAKQEELHRVFADRVLIQAGKQNMLLSEIGRRAGFSRSTMHQYVSNGRHLPRLDKLAAIAQVLHVSTDYLCGLTDEEGSR